ncbi:MAG TPA: hypothetical protein DGG95_12055 [Cytophagales bacterium]|nr:hypothetical protein [Cytophagales bacterium]
MNSKDSILLISGSVAGIIGTFLHLTHTAGGDFFQGLGSGFMIVLAFNVLPKIFKRKNETFTK